MHSLTLFLRKEMLVGSTILMEKFALTLSVYLVLLCACLPAMMCLKPANEGKAENQCSKSVCGQKSSCGRYSREGKKENGEARDFSSTWICCSSCDCFVEATFEFAFLHPDSYKTENDYFKEMNSPGFRFDFFHPPEVKLSFNQLH